MLSKLNLNVLLCEIYLADVYIGIEDSIIQRPLPRTIQLTGTFAQINKALKSFNKKEAEYNAKTEQLEKFKRNEPKIYRFKKWLDSLFYNNPDNPHDDTLMACGSGLTGLSMLIDMVVVALVTSSMGCPIPVILSSTISSGVCITGGGLSCSHFSNSRAKKINEEVNELKDELKTRPSTQAIVMTQNEINAEESQMKWQVLRVGRYRT